MERETAAVLPSAEDT